MTEEQKETLRFYTANDYLLINGLLWGEDAETVDQYIRLVNEDGRGVMAEALAQGFDVRWNCSREEGERLYEVYRRRFPLIDQPGIKEKILAQAGRDISNMMACLKPLASDLVLYRNMKTRYVNKLTAGSTLNHPGFSSCSLRPHAAENASYGSGGCTLAEILVPAGMPAIRLDLLPDVRNEPDEVILAPAAFLVTRTDREMGRISLTCLKPLTDTTI